MCRWNRCSAVGTTKRCRFCGTRFCTACLRGDFKGIIKNNKCAICKISILRAETVELASKPDKKENLWNVVTPTQAAWNIYAAPCSKRMKILQFISELKYHTDYKSTDDIFTQFNALLSIKPVVIKPKLSTTVSSSRLGGKKPSKEKAKAPKIRKDKNDKKKIQKVKTDKRKTKKKKNPKSK